MIYHSISATDGEQSSRGAASRGESERKANQQEERAEERRISETGESCLLMALSYIMLYNLKKASKAEWDDDYIKHIREE